MILITRPNHDVTTNYLYFWSQLIIDQAKKTNKQITDLSKKRANPKEFTSVILKTQPSFVVLNGHGNERSVTGYDDEVLVESGKNEHLLAKKIVYARSCQSAKILGATSIKAGCLTYIGYDDDFVFFIEDNFLSRPLKDKTAQKFLEPSNYVISMLLKGHSTKESNRRSKDMYKKTIQNLTTSAASKEESELAPYLV